MPDDVEAALRAKAHSSKTPTEVLIINLVKWYVAAPADNWNEAVSSYPEADDAAIAKGIAAADAGRVRSVQDAFAAWLWV